MPLPKASSTSLLGGEAAQVLWLMSTWVHVIGELC